MFYYRETVSKNIHMITFDNIIKDNNAVCYIKHAIKSFLLGSEIFMGHYRLDGFNLTPHKIKKYSVEIPEYFKYNGEILYLKTFKKPGDGLTICRCKNQSFFYDELEKILDFYLETILFCPKLSWFDFANFHKNYMNITAFDYILNGFADILFLYNDSGDFSVLFNLDVYSAEFVHNQLEAINKEIIAISGDSIIEP